MSSSLGCAVGNDGNLLEETHIDFYNDPDDLVPISGPSCKTTASTLNGYITRTTPAQSPADFIAGSRCSARVPRPSEKIKLTMDSNRPETVAAGAKRRAEASLERISARRRYVIASSDQSDGDVVSTEVGTNNGNNSDSKDNEDVEAAYIETKSLGDADRKAMNARPKDDRTADIRTTFQREKGSINPDTAEKEDGHWCMLCKAKGLPRRDSFFTGSISTLRAHIRRAPGHYKHYRRVCEEKKILMHPRAIPERSGDDGLSRQGTLDSVIIQQPRIPTFSAAGLLDYIVELVVSEDKAMRIIDQPAFRNLIQFCRPNVTEKDIPHRTKLHKEIIERAKRVEIKVKKSLQDALGEISFTFDSWTSDPGDPFLSVTAHYIAAPIDAPLDWELKVDQLAFKHIEGNHSGLNIGGILVETVDRYNIRNKVGWFTSDNAANNDTALKSFGKTIDPFKECWDPISRRARCMEHSVHLGSGHFVAAVSPTSTSNVVKKIHMAVDRAENEDDDDDDEVNDNVDIGDAVGKALGLIKQIRKSPQARAFFKKCCEETKVPVLELRLWVRTRWASLFECLDRLLTLQPAVNRFTLLADDCPEVPTLRGKSYSIFRLFRVDWEKLELMHEVLQEPANATQSFSSSKHPTVSRIIPVLEFLQQSWENMSRLPKFMEISDAIQEGLDNLQKWYRRTEDTDIYFICLVLDPTIKSAYTKENWANEDHERGMDKLRILFNKYYEQRPTDLIKDNSRLSQNTVASDSSNHPKVVQYGHSWMRKMVQDRKNADNRSPADLQAELNAYLKEPIEDYVENVVRWWGHNSIRYPTLSRIARDYLAIQGSAVASERAFSSGALTGTKRRNRLNVESFEALQILKSGYRNGHISASQQAQAHMDSFLQSLDSYYDADSE